MQRHDSFNSMQVSRMSLVSKPRLFAVPFVGILIHQPTNWKTMHDTARSCWSRSASCAEAKAERTVAPTPPGCTGALEFDGGADAVFVGRKVRRDDVEDEGGVGMFKRRRTVCGRGGVGAARF